VLRELGPTAATDENDNNELGVPLTALVADETTRHLVLEMGARALGDIAYLTGVAPPRIGLVLNVGAAHSSEFGGKEATARAKSELVQALPDGSDGGIAVLNADDPFVAGMAEATDARVVWFGTAANADVRGDDVTIDAQGRPAFQLHARDSSARVSLQLHGAHQVSNALAVAAVAIELGLDVAATADSLSRATARSRWRMQVTRRDDGVTVINDAYNANPDSMAAGLRALTALAHGRRTWAVLGPMAELGDQTADAHRDLGQLAGTLGVNHVVAVGPDAEAIARHAGAATEAEAVPDVDVAIAFLQRELRAGDVVLVKASRSAGLERVADALVAGTVPA
jgi:UDP-N-acetylmuramoyl-tripeptide--D-alanyl-D-alanine ligase